MSEQKNQKSDEQLIEQVVRVCADRGACAMLRRYWSVTTRHYAFPVLARLPVQSFDSPDAMAAALYAVNPNHNNGGPRLGQALYRLAHDKDPDAFERHFRRLLASESLEDAADQLHRLFKRLDRSGLGLDYNSLLWDLRKWRNDREGVRTGWATDFWLKPAEMEAAMAAGVAQTLEASE